MSEQDAFEHTLASLYDAMLDDSRWPAASALIDETCGLTGNSLILGDGPKDDIRVSFVGVYQRGQRRTDIEREYLTDYHPADERVPRVRQLPDSRLVHVTDVYSAGELKTSPTYNEILRRARHQDSLAVRLEVSAELLHNLGPGRPRGPAGLGRLADHDDQAAAALHPPVCACPAGARARPGAGNHRGRLT